MVLVDTSVWSLALRRPAHRLSEVERRHVHEWTGLVRRGEAALIGVVRQDLLTGIRDFAAFQRLRVALRSFPDERLTTEDFEDAARADNLCRVAGLSGSGVDYLLCAAALRHGMPIYATDRDFERYAEHLPLRLHQPAP